VKDYFFLYTAISGKRNIKAAAAGAAGAAGCHLVTKQHLVIPPQGQEVSSYCNIGWFKILPTTFTLLTY
jgi:hypothetical protein